MKINCIIIDDEPLALKLMEDFALRVPFLNLIAAFNNPIEATTFIETNSVDLVFLDVNMPDINGLQLLKKISKNVMAVFCTAYSHHAIESFELQALDYLLKPYSFDRFLKAACKAQEQFILRRSFEKKEIPVIPESDDYLFVKSDYSLVKITIPDIILLEGLKDYIKIYTITSPKPVLTLQSLRALEEKLPASCFCRVHKSFIINIKMLKSVQRNHLIIAEREIPIGNQYKEAFLTIVGNKTPGK